MKKLLLLSVMLLAFAGCSRDETTSPGDPGDRETVDAPHFYGMAMLDNPATETRGIAINVKVWSKPAAENSLSVKFLNGSAAYRAFVQEVVKEWEKAGGVRFHFVDDNRDAMIRIGFDYVPGMMSSWALTGTDHVDVFDRQTEPTVHFAQWRRASDAQKRSDVLRAFGQVLGLELEFRHPKFSPGWVTIAGTEQIDEERIRNYWMDELAEFISWEELKTMVLDPISYSAEQITHTLKYDSESVMNWPFYEQIANGLKPIEFDSDYRTELSEQDKEFIVELYGKSFGEVPPFSEYLPLIEFDYTGTAPRFSVTTTERLVVIWDKEADACSFVDLPAGSTGPYTATLSHTFAESKARKIIIGEMLEYGEKMPENSYALTRFDFLEAAGAENIHVAECNKALEKVWIRGDKSNNFTPQALVFPENTCLRELYLVNVNLSHATVDNNKGLEVFATSPTVCKPRSITGPRYATEKGYPISTGGDVYETVGPVATWPALPADSVGWPCDPALYPSLSTVDMQNCSKIKTISLDNTEIVTLDLSVYPDLEYLLLTSTYEYITGGADHYGKNLLATIRTLPVRDGKSTGLIVIRGISYLYLWGDDPVTMRDVTLETPQPYFSKRYVRFQPVLLKRSYLREINTILGNRNWQIVWDSGCNTIVD